MLVTFLSFREAPSGTIERTNSYVLLHTIAHTGPDITIKVISFGTLNGCWLTIRFLLHMSLGFKWAGITRYKTRWITVPHAVLHIVLKPVSKATPGARLINVHRPGFEPRFPNTWKSWAHNLTVGQEKDGTLPLYHVFSTFVIVIYYLMKLQLNDHFTYTVITFN